LIQCKPVPHLDGLFLTSDGDATPMLQQVSINGRILPRSRARVSVADGGFLHGEGVFETIRLYAGKAIFIEEHLHRLTGGARMLGLVCPPGETIRREIGRLVRANRVREDAVCRISLSRAPQGRARRNAATRVIFLRALGEETARDFERGVHARTLGFERAAGPSASLKTLSYLPSLLALRAADLAGASEAIFISSGDLVLEGATTNIFARVENVFVTPPTDGRILPGVTRQRLLSLGGEGVPSIKEAPLEREALLGASEIFLTNAVRELIPVIRLDGRPVGGGRPGPFTRALQERWRTFVESLVSPPPRKRAQRRKRPGGAPRI